MNAIQMLAAQSWVNRLGAVLLSFVWQGVAIAGVYAVVRKSLPRSSGPNARYLLACAALLVMSAAPVVTWSFLGPPTPAAVRASFTAPPVVVTTPAVPDRTPSWQAVAAGPLPAPLLPWVVAAWLAGTIVLWLRLFGSWVQAERLRSRFVRPAPADWQPTLQRLQLRIRLLRPVRLLVSGAVQGPAALGWLRPAILMPVGAFAGLPAAQVEALLLHELAHIRRHDYLVNMLQSVVESLLFYHPAVWWVSGHIREERELCCDDTAVAVTGDALSYARALAELGAASLGPHGATLAATGGSLARRIARLLGQDRPFSGAHSGPGLAATAAVLAVTAFALFGQQEERPRFDAASIKPGPDQGFRFVRALPGRISANAPLRLLLQNAYAVQGFQIVGGPSWIDEDRFAIEAKAAEGASRAQLFLMLQSLIEQRFHLQIHRETRQLPAQALVVAKSGLKLPAPTAGACDEPDPSAQPDWAGGRIAPPAGRPVARARCGTVSFVLRPGGARMQGGRVTIAELVRSISMVLERPVIDRTGQSGQFDIQMDFLADETTPALPPPPPGSGMEGPSFVSALQQQLGLRLESSTGPVGVIVIDHVERPTAN